MGITSRSYLKKMIILNIDIKILNLVYIYNNIFNINKI